VTALLQSQLPALVNFADSSERVIRAFLIHLQEWPDCAEAGPAALPDLTHQHGQAFVGPAWPTRRAGEDHP
jgi:hypothetical protein